MAGNDLTLKDIQSIIGIVKSAENIQDFSLKLNGTEINISRGAGQPTSQRAELPAAPSAPPQPSIAAPVAKALAAAKQTDYGSNATLIKSSMVGTFYRAPGPGEPPFVEIGQKVKGDDVLCILEVIRQMNFIASPVEGNVTHILVENGDPVEFGQVMMVIQGVD